MALSERFVEEHILFWSKELESVYPHRKQWPSCVFHHAPLETAVMILNDGCLRSRNDPRRGKARDIAAPGVIDNRREAHERARLYFRPRTPTQFSIEGIRKDDECPYGLKTHAPVLVMFVLDARAVLVGRDVIFSDRNMQRTDVRTGDGEAFFASIPFQSVFHEGGTAGDKMIIAHRCAEVLPASPLLLKDVLKGIWFRSEPERETLLYRLHAAQRGAWEDYLARLIHRRRVFRSVARP